MSSRLVLQSCWSSSNVTNFFNVQSLNWGLDRALDYYTQRPEWWQDLVRKAMLIDFSWDASADQYVDLYKKVLSKVKV